MTPPYKNNTDLQALINEMPQLMKDEGFVDEIYLDTLGYPTFGFGTLIAPHMPEYGCDIGTKVSQERCAQAFFGELMKKTLDDGPRVFGDAWFTFPMQAKQVFYNMAYNLGATRLSKFKQMIKAAEEHDWTWAAAELVDSLYARQVKARATRLSQRLLSLDNDYELAFTEEIRPA